MLIGMIILPVSENDNGMKYMKTITRKLIVLDELSWQFVKHLTSIRAVMHYITNNKQYIL